MADSTYIAINPIGTVDPKNELQISANYQQGGVNYIHGTHEGSGVYISLCPVLRKDGIVRQAILARTTKEMGFKVLVHPMFRKSRKQIERAFGAVQTIKEQIADLYNQDRFAEICDLIKTTVANAK